MPSSSVRSLSATRWDEIGSHAHQKFKGNDKGLDADSGLDCHMFGCVRISASTDPGPLAADPLTPGQRRIMALPQISEAVIRCASCSILTG
jgi:hypothetical protein